MAVLYSFTLTTTRAFACALLVTLFWKSGVTVAADQLDAVSADQCTSLGNVKLAGKINSARIVAAGEFVPPATDIPGSDYSKLPAFCRIVGNLSPTADSKIGFELWLPRSGWNGRFLQVGNSAAAGAIVYPALADGLQRGYAVANTDTGHVGGRGDFSWAMGHPEKITDYAYRAVHEVTVVSQKLTKTYFRQQAKRSFWLGCSTGGRQGLMEAQRFPQDYDAIVVGAPANNWAPLMAYSIVLDSAIGIHGLPVKKIPLLTRAAIQKCDLLDGVADGVIGNPAACNFDPADLQCVGTDQSECLTAEETQAAARAYGGVVDRDGRTLFAGPGAAGERFWVIYSSPQFDFGANFFRAVVAKDLSWNPLTFDVGKDLPRLERASQSITAISPDLSAFFAKGGKLLMYHGTIDGAIPISSTNQYYASVVNKMDAASVNTHVRYFTVAGMDHCRGGEGASVVDWLGAMEHWDSTSNAPEVLEGMHAPGASFRRPVCRYPALASFNGSGNPDDAANWSCKGP